MKHLDLKLRTAIEAKTQLNKRPSIGSVDVEFPNKHLYDQSDETWQTFRTLLTVLKKILNTPMGDLLAAVSAVVCA